MKNTLLLLLSLACSGISAQALDFPRHGFSLTLPDDWEQIPSDDEPDGEDPPTTLMAQKSGSPDHFFVLLVQPSSDLPATPDQVEPLRKSIAEELDIENLKGRFERLGGADWVVYEGDMEDGMRIWMYYSVQHFHSFAFSFLSVDGSKKMGAVAKKIVAGMRFTRPTVFDEIDRAFQEFHTDKMTGLKVPAGYRFAQKFTQRQVPGYVFDLYEHLQNTKSTDAVLVADDFYQSAFALNVDTGEATLDSLGMVLIARVAGRQIEQQEQIRYEEISLGPWPRAPERVFMSHFRLYRPEGPTIHYVYYVTRSGYTDILKIQMPEGMQRELGPAMERWVLANLE